MDEELTKVLPPVMLLHGHACTLGLGPGFMQPGPVCDAPQNVEELCSLAVRSRQARKPATPHQRQS